MKEKEKEAQGQRYHSYVLRGIPSVLFVALKHRAIDESRTMRDLILKALEKYLGGK